ncbi:MAG: hypothetical protein ACI92E_002312, partial [Oceanicoccus sp.]
SLLVFNLVNRSVISRPFSLPNFQLTPNSFSGIFRISLPLKPTGKNDERRRKH